MRHIIYGAGAVGGAIGGELSRAGRDVILIARGAHLAAIHDNGLTLRTASGESVHRITAVEHPREIAFQPSDVVFLTMKSQDTAAALRELALVAPPGITVICAQNGVANETMALRHFNNVLAMLILLPATMIAPGIIENTSQPPRGILDFAPFPSGDVAASPAIARDLTDAGFSARVTPGIMRMKYSKLLENLGTVLLAVTKDTPERTLYGATRREAEAIYDKAGIDWASEAEMKARRDEVAFAPYPSVHRGGSTTQSLLRGTGSVEADYLCGEIAALGRLHGMQAPINQALQHLCNALAANRLPPGSVPMKHVLAQIEAVRAGGAPVLP